MRLSGSVKLYWSVGPGAGSGGALRLPCGQLRGILRLLGLHADRGAGFPFGARLGESGFARLAALHFLRHSQAILQRRGVGLVRLGQEGRDLEFHLLERRSGVRVTHGRVLARTGQHFRAVDGHGDPADCEHPAARRQFQHLGEHAAEERAVFLPEGAEGVVIRVRVRAEHPHRHAVVGRQLDAAAAKRAGRVAIDQQRQQQTGRILRAAAALFVHPHALQVEGLHRFQNEMDQMIFRHPVPQIRGQQQRRVPVDVDEACGHASVQQASRQPGGFHQNGPAILFSSLRTKSDRLLEQSPPSFDSPGGNKDQRRRGFTWVDRGQASRGRQGIEYVQSVVSRFEGGLSRRDPACCGAFHPHALVLRSRPGPWLDFPPESASKPETTSNSSSSIPLWRN